MEKHASLEDNILPIIPLECRPTVNGLDAHALLSAALCSGIYVSMKVQQTWPSPDWEKLVLLLKGYVFTIWQMTCIYSTLHNFNYKVVGSFIGNYHLPFVSSWPNVIFVIIYSPKSEFLSFVEVCIDFCGIFYTQRSMETNNSSQHSSRSLLLCSADVWNNLRVSKWRQNLNFGWIIPLICALKCEALKLL